ncbi:NUDIX domain-containing protein [Spiribacter aquaticus]|uniref:ADP-ribose pyrophosphatase n=2 Tax=Spiribacter TaxID=1335745 RepID=A0A557RJ66_9GAMM|nr:MULTISPECIES: NUDIX domain-containing protein [Spiribacter]KAF0280264.1 ADP-ribose diphosphatase [Spiribacter roseus]KAF0285921.1 ADP-ribose diphosphatase [Spiribacter sp. SSL99]TVO65200.1 NUDIX domain-containing protein [Spiribacter aquaticus]
MPRDYEIIARETVHDGFFQVSRFTLRHALFAGGQSEVLVRERLERGNAVAVLPYDPWLDQVVLVEQFRVGALETGFGPWVLETIAGIIEPGERDEDVAHRETREEADCALGELMPIAHYLVSPGGSSQTARVYCAPVDSRDLRREGHGHPDEGEDIRVHVVPADEAIAMLDSGALTAAMPIIALQWLALNRAVVRDRWQAMPRAPYNGPASTP